MIRPDGYYAVPTRAIAVEQTHNRGGGAVIPLATLRALRAVADEAGVALHCDGARIWHAHVADGVPLADLRRALRHAVGLPVQGPRRAGRLAGRRHRAERIARARLIRKRMGGGMRQAGILAAAGRYALAHHVDRLADDHARARAARRGAGAVRGGRPGPGTDQHRAARPDARPRWTRPALARGGPRAEGVAVLGDCGPRPGPADHPPGRRRRHGIDRAIEVLTGILGAAEELAPLDATRLRGAR